MQTYKVNGKVSTRGGYLMSFWDLEVKVKDGQSKAQALQQSLWSAGFRGKGLDTEWFLLHDDGVQLSLFAS